MGEDEAVPHASQAPARFRVPASRTAAARAPLHSGADHLFGRPLDPQVHCGRHHFPCHGASAGFIGHTSPQNLKKEKMLKI